MTRTVLVDNRTDNPALETEHGLSILLETEKHNILLDTGAKLTELSHRLADAYPQTQFYTSHCTGDAAFAILQGVMGDKIHNFSR